MVFDCKYCDISRWIYLVYILYFYLTYSSVVGNCTAFEDISLCVVIIYSYVIGKVKSAIDTLIGSIGIFIHQKWFMCFTFMGYAHSRNEYICALEIRIYQKLN